jgi:hypothetical protein
MSLPVIPLPSSSVEVNGTPVSFRSLSRSEAIVLQGMRGDLDEQDAFVIMCGTDSTREDVDAFRSATAPMEAGRLTDAILVLSGLAEGEDAAGDPVDPKAATNGRSRTEPSLATRS